MKFVEVLTKPFADQGAGESGFTIIELVVTSVILGLLAALSLGAFTVYKDQANYSKGEAAMRNARMGLVVGETELPEGYNLPYLLSATTGGPFAGELARIMPGGTTSAEVRVGAEIQTCDAASGAFDRHQYLTVESCKSEKALRWQRFCGGTEILLEHVANPAPCA